MIKLISVCFAVIAIASSSVSAESNNTNEKSVAFEVGKKKTTKGREMLDDYMVYVNKYCSKKTDKEQALMCDSAFSLISKELKEDPKLSGLLTIKTKSKGNENE